ncbi:MAG: alanine racemase [Maricaulaceae bacterium]
MPPPHEMTAQYSARATLKIDLGAVQRNYHALQNKLGRSVKLASSIKADAYGLGAIRVGKTLYGAGCRNFFVATPGEGKILRQAIGDTASIFVLNGPAPRDLALYHGADLKPVINSFEQAKVWLDMISDARRHPACAIHIDTGMNRLGFGLKDLELLAGNKRMVEKLVPVLIMSHLACASDPNSKMNDAQLGRFRRLAAKFPVMPLSLANSPGIYLGKQYHFQMVRAGLGLYAKDISNDKANNITENALSLMAPVLQVRNVAKGESLGYNASYVAKRDMKIAIVGAGYADGIPVASSSTHTQGGGYARMQGLTVPIVGRVSMDLTILEVTNLRRELQLGDWAEFLGNDLLALAKSAGTIPYEILVRMGSRCRRDYFSSDPDN